MNKSYSVGVCIEKYWSIKYIYYRTIQDKRKKKMIVIKIHVVLTCIVDSHRTLFAPHQPTLFVVWCRSYPRDHSSNIFGQPKFKIEWKWYRDSYDLTDICWLQVMFTKSYTMGPIGSSESFGAVVFSFATLKTLLECTSIPSKSEISEASISVYKQCIHR